MIVGADPMTPDTLDQRPVDGGERIGVAVDALRVPVLGGHPEVPFDGFGDSIGELMVKDRTVTPKLGEQIVGKTVLPQGGIRQIHRRGGGHTGSWFCCP